MIIGYMYRVGHVPKRLCPETVMSRSGYVPKRLCPEMAMTMSRNGYVPKCPTFAVFTMQNVLQRSGARAYTVSDDASADQRYCGEKKEVSMFIRPYVKLKLKGCEII